MNQSLQVELERIRLRSDGGGNDRLEDSILAALATSKIEEQLQAMGEVVAAAAALGDKAWEDTLARYRAHVIAHRIILVGVAALLYHAKHQRLPERVSDLGLDLQWTLPGEWEPKLLHHGSTLFVGRELPSSRERSLEISTFFISE
ncbi:MAG: hypothetical protein AAF581_22630 [Planctomycetota bacterium]